MNRSQRIGQCVAATLLVLGTVLPQTAEALQIFQPYRTFTANSLSGSSSFTVPINTTFVVESISGRITPPTGKQIVNFQMFTSPTNNPPTDSVVLYIEPKLLARSVFDGQTFPQDVYTFNTATRAYFKSTVFISVVTDSFDLPTNVGFSAQGYLIPTLTADFNLNGVVDAADYVTWRRQVNTPLTAGTFDADASGDGNVDGVDYSIWRANFAPTAAAASVTSAAVPEPTTCAVLAVGLTGIGLSCGRNRHRRLPIFRS